MIQEPIPKDKLLPVMVFFHGGGWMCGDGTTDMYGPEHLLDRDVLFVALNYRLGKIYINSKNHCVIKEDFLEECPLLAIRSTLYILVFFYTK